MQVRYDGKTTKSDLRARGIVKEVDMAKYEGLAAHHDRKTRDAADSRYADRDYEEPGSEKKTFKGLSTTYKEKDVREMLSLHSPENSSAFGRHWCRPFVSSRHLPHTRAFWDLNLATGQVRWEDDHVGLEGQDWDEGFRVQGTARGA